MEYIRRNLGRDYRGIRLVALVHHQRENFLRICARSRVKGKNGETTLGRIISDLNCYRFLVSLGAPAVVERTQKQEIGNCVRRAESSGDDEIPFSYSKHLARAFFSCSRSHGYQSSPSSNEANYLIEFLPTSDTHTQCRCCLLIWQPEDVNSIQSMVTTNVLSIMHAAVNMDQCRREFRIEIPVSIHFFFKYERKHSKITGKN